MAGARNRTLPAQVELAAKQRFLRLRAEHALTVDNVKHILVRLPANGAGIVDNRAMPDVNLQHIVAVGSWMASSRSRIRMRTSAWPIRACSRRANGSSSWRIRSWSASQRRAAASSKSRSRTIGE
jgi:hypothetical protein